MTRTTAGSSQAHGSTLMPIVARLDEVLQEETAALRRQDTSGLGHIFQRKSQALLELVSAQRSLGNAVVDETAQAALVLLRRTLGVNRDVLKLHIDAAAELIEVFSQAIRDSESDGTYDASYGQRGRR